LKKTEHAPIENPPITGIPRPLVMLVEPDEEIQAIVHRVCNNLGYGFVLAKDGQDGLELALHYRPNLILAEAFLPKLDGREVCRVLKLDGSDFRAVVLTGLYTDTRYKAEALERFRVDDYASKPVSITELINLLEKHLEGVTGLPAQEDLHEQHRREIAPPPQRVEHYEVLCASCSRPFDAARAAWCADNDPTLLCSACGHCFCEAAPGYRERFWSEAPPLLFERKTIVANRARGMRPKDVKRPLVLLADGDENIELLVRTVATTLGYGFVAASREKAGEYNPDLVLSGRELPKPLEVEDVMQLLKKPASQ
jgi:CheY-like chemotaxis protein